MIEEEVKAREELIIYSKQKIEDLVMRAYGILTNARIITTQEALDLLSTIRFGIELGMLPEIGYDTINRLMLIIQPGYIQLLKSKRMGEGELALFRAELIQELLN
jgi:protein arginine kinase